MSAHLPEVNQTIAMPPVPARKTPYFPSIFRFIPERTLSLEYWLGLPGLLLSCLVSSAILFLALNQYILLNQNRHRLSSLVLERQGIERELAYWRKTADNYNNYPDIYLKIASLEYRLNNTDEAEILVNKALSLNPNAEAGRVLGTQIKR